ncbi:MAG: hypothetical protein IJ019_03360 [Alphaproteobacteria bacterium]|nr:hypothetical protein [Alphaproteobacteria bacterium]
MFYEDTVEQTWDKISYSLTGQPQPTTREARLIFCDKLFSPPILEKMDGKMGEYLGYYQPSKRYRELRSFILKRLSDETTKEQTLEICKKFLKQDVRCSLTKKRNHTIT